MRVTHLNALRALEAALRKGSFSAAAEELGVTPAAVGQQVRTLEEYLGIELFHRSKGGTKSTRVAQRVETRLTASFSTLADVLTQLRAVRPERQISVTFPSSFAENWLTHYISEFYRNHSSVDLRLDASNRMVDLLTEEFDFALRYSRPAGKGFAEVVLFGDYVLPVCSPEFALRYELTPEKRSLKGVPLVHLGKRTPDPEWADWQAWGTAFGFAAEPLRQGVQYMQLSSGLQAALSGQGLVLCGVTEAFVSIREGRLVMPFGSTLRCPTGYKYRLVWLLDRELSELQLSFKDWLLDTVAEFSREVDDLLGASVT